MSEPDYIAQTFEPEHVAERDSMYAWFDVQAAEARKIGCTFPRYSRSEDGTGVLFEAWKVRPFDQGEPRWHLEPALPTKENP